MCRATILLLVALLAGLQCVQPAPGPLSMSLASRSRRPASAAGAESPAAAPAFSYSLSTYCQYGERKSASVMCPLSRLRIQHNCTGSEGEFKTLCPGVLSPAEIACRSIEGILISENETAACSVVSYNAANATCHCEVQDSSSSSNSSNVMEAELIVPLDSGQTYVPTGSAQTHFYKFNGSYAPEETAIEVFIIFSYMFLAFLIWICLTQLKPDIPVETDEHFDLTIGDCVRNEARAVQLVSNALPEVYDVLNSSSNSSSSSSSSSNLGGGIFSLVALSNRWIRWFFFRDTSRDSDMAALAGIAETFISALTAMLLATIVYHITDVDDDYCYQLVSSQECLKERTAFYDSEHVCRWDESATRCQFRRPLDNPINTCYVALVIALCCAPVTYWLLQVFLYANADVRGGGCPPPPLSPTREKTVFGRIFSPGNNSIHSASASASTPGEDFEFLNRNLCRKRSKMKEGPLKNAFVHEWGISGSRNSGSDAGGGGDGGLPPLQHKWPWQCRTVYEDASRVLYEDISKAHRCSQDVLRDVGEVESTVGALGVMQRSLESYCDVKVIQSLLLDLLPPFQSGIVQSTIHREEPPILFISNRMFLLAADLVLFVYMWGAGITIMYFAIERRRPLQVLWAYTLLAWFLLDFFLFQPSLVYITKYWCPSLANSTAQCAKAAIIRTLVDLDSDVSPVIFKMPAAALATSRYTCSMPDKQVAPDAVMARQTTVEHGKAASQLGLMLFSSARVATGLSRFKVHSRAMDLVLKFASPYPRFSLSQHFSLFSKLRTGLTQFLVEHDVFVACYVLLLPRLGTFAIELLLIGLWTLLFYFSVEAARTRSIGYFCGAGAIALLLLWVSPVGNCHSRNLPLPLNDDAVVPVDKDTAPVPVPALASASASAPAMVVSDELRSL
jgi:hypothetical protein